MKFYFNCPKCRLNDSFYSVEESADGTGCLLLFFGGLIPFLLFRSDRGNRIQCGNCGYIFHQPGVPFTPTARVAVALILLILAVPIYLIAISNTPSHDRMLPGGEWIESIEETVREHPRAAVYAAGGVLIVTIVTLAILAIASNASYRKLLSVTYKLTPDDQPLRKQPAVNGNQPAPRDS